MFDTLSNRLMSVFDKLRQRGLLQEADVTDALREIRVALLEADVALPVVRSFIETVKIKAIGQEVLQSISPGQMVVKIVHDALIELLNPVAEKGQPTGLNLAAAAPVTMMMVGLQGSGKTTTTAKLARILKTQHRKRVLMVSLDVYRPAAQEQLAILGEKIQVSTLEIIPQQTPQEITARALTVARQESYEVVLFDTAGRLHIDEALMAELRAVHAQIKPLETLLVADAMTGQDAVTIAQAFKESVAVTGIILTRMDGDGRGGAALSLRFITGSPIKYLGVGEKIDQLEAFDAERVAGRILNMGDVVGLVEKMAATLDQAETEKMAAKISKGDFDLDDMAVQLAQIHKMGGVGGLISLLPGMNKIKDQLGSAGVNDKMVNRQIAIIRSMTRKERRDYRLLNGSRKRRVAKGAGVQVPDVNKLLKQFQDMATMMKRMNKMGQKGLLRQGLKNLLPF